MGIAVIKVAPKKPTETAIDPSYRAGRRPTSRDFYPLRQTRPFLAFDIHDIRVAFAPTPHSVLLDRIRRTPVFLFLEPLLLVQRSFFVVLHAGELSRGRIGRAMLNRCVSVAEIPKVMYVLRTQQSSGCERVDRRITPPLHPKPSTAIHHLEELLVFFAPEPIQSGNLEIAPKMTHVVSLAFHGLGVNFGRCFKPRIGIQHLLRKRLRFVFLIQVGRLFLLLPLWSLEKHFPQALGSNVVRSFVSGGVAEDIRYSLPQLLDRDSKAIRLLVSLHVNEGIISDVAKVFDLRLQSPIPFVLLEKLVLIEEPGNGSVNAAARLNHMRIYPE